MKKIMFNEHFGLQQSVLDGTKDMTRRICTMTLHRKMKDGTMEEIEPDDMFIASDGTALFQIGRNGYRVPKENQPAYKVGEEIAIAQPYKVTAQQNREWLDLQLAANGQYIGELMDSGGWEKSEMRYFCNSRVYNAFPAVWKSIIKQPYIPASIGNNSTTIVESQDYIYLPSCSIPVYDHKVLTTAFFR